MIHHPPSQRLPLDAFSVSSLRYAKFQENEEVICIRMGLVTEEGLDFENCNENDMKKAEDKKGEESFAGNLGLTECVLNETFLSPAVGTCFISCPWEYRNSTSTLRFSPHLFELFPSSLSP